MRRSFEDIGRIGRSRKIVFDIVLCSRFVFLDSNRMRSWRLRIVVQRGDEFEVVGLFGGIGV